MTNRPNYKWDARNARYRTVRGQYVAADDVVEAMDMFLRNQQSGAADLLFDLLRSGQLNVREVQIVGEKAIARAHMASAMAAKGGRAQMAQADYGRVGGFVSGELRHWRDRMKRLANGAPIDATVRNSFRSYFSAAANTFFAVEQLELEKRGFDEYMNLLDDGAHHCIDGALPSCRTVTARGYRPTGTLPQRGRRSCRWGCRCRWRYRNSLTGEVRK